VERIAFIGGGFMATAMIRGLVRGGVVTPAQIIVGEPVAEQRARLAREHGVRVTPSNQEAAAAAQVVVLAVKPQHSAAALADLRGRLASDQLLLSIMAGVRIQTIQAGAAHQAVVRVMPNTPAHVGKAMSVWTAAPEVTAEQRVWAQAILRSIGAEVYVENEHYLDIATGVSGSGPGYVYLFIEAFIDAAVRAGFTWPVAQELVLQTMEGSVALARELKLHPAQLRNMVTSAGGTTAAGLYELERAGLRAALADCVMAAYQRAVELGREPHETAHVQES
jgi:pyrroline-5-carboxylate reductase